ncbi:CAP domain-containing protein [Planktotalea sp.]|uniref:CAP domain-containing protein n=1 Tax=Planktotalea sp. TaxID=2029877 RepID=UPI0025FD079B|nr:CAP domain-containing protein [Planktotalea sp.]
MSLYRCFWVGLHSFGCERHAQGSRRSCPANGQAPLAADARLARAAQLHANDMSAKTYFSHTGQDGSSAGDRVKRQGYGYCFVAENIAQGQKGALQALAGWQKSPGHRKNLLTANAIHFGMAEKGGYWVMVLGKTGC